MRNLKASSCSVHPVDDRLRRAQCFCLDCDTGSVWVVTSTDLCCVDTASKEVQAVTSLTDHMTSCDRVVAMDYLMDTESVCLGLSGGSILTYAVATGELVSVGEVEDGGIVCMAWSPEQDLVVVVTGADQIILMTRDFDPLNEKTLYQDDFGEAKPMTVGWGKKETQFRGKEGKPRPEDLRKKEPGPALEWDDRRVRLSWRGNGEYFACSTVDSSARGGSRVIRIWNRECILQCTCESLDGLQQALAWKPSGYLLASLQRKPHRDDVVFFEPNGLQHGEFLFQTLPVEWRVKELLWSHDSTVLCAWCVGGRGSGEEELVQLWTMGNYHWYLKQNIHLPKRKRVVKVAGRNEEQEDGRSCSLVGLQWDPVIALRLHLLTADGQYICYNWEWTISESRSHSTANVSGVAVIDGCEILYTPFRYAVVPPPMSSSQLTLPSPVGEVTFGPTPRCNDFLALLSDSRVAVFSVEPVGDEEKALRHPAPELVGMSRIEGVGGSFHALRQCVWWREDSVVGVAVDEVTGQERIVQLTLELDRVKRTISILPGPSVAVTGGVVCLHGNPASCTVVVHLASGEVLNWTGEGKGGMDDPAPSLTPRQLASGIPLKFPQPCGKIELAWYKDKERLVGLNERRGKLFVDDLQLTSGCTSFAVHDEYLLLITNTHFCRFVSLLEEPKALVPLDVDELDKQQSLHFDLRRVEMGSRVVTVVPGNTRLVLQMPRGNLEVVSPRALTLAQIRKNLDRLEFGEAFRSARTNRINFNLLYDYNPRAFLDNVSKFVKDLASVTAVNLFLTSLMEEDVTKATYPLPRHSCRDTPPEGEKAEGNVSETRTKLDTVCNAVREELARCGKDRYTLSIITTYVKMTHPQIDNVLRIIQNLKESASSSSNVKDKDRVTVDSALKYTLYMVDVNRLYDIALGTYDLPLVVMVAEKSQKDPKEYLPFLNQLRKLPLNYQRYKIDCHLKRYEKALQHITKCGPDKFQECLTLIKEHCLYKQALLIYTDKKSEEYKAIASAYGSQLSGSGQYKDAGLVFSQCGFYEDALEAFERGGCWEQVFVAASRLQLTEAQKMEAGRRVANSLKSSRRFLEASRVLLDYVSDPEEAIVALLEGSCWDEALRLVHYHRRVDLLETHFLPGVGEARENQLSLLETFRSDFQRRFARLVVVRENIRKKLQAILEGTYAVDEKDADLFSDTSSITGRSLVSSTDSSRITSSSLRSKTSGRSTKSRKKAENKKHRLREGSRYEEEALVEVLREVVTSSDGVREDVHKLLSTLTQFGRSGEALELQTRYEELLEAIRKEMNTIWPPETSSQTTIDTPSSLGLGPGATVNSILAARAAAATSPLKVVAPSGPAPRLRDEVKWRLESL